MEDEPLLRISENQERYIKIKGLVISVCLFILHYAMGISSSVYIFAKITDAYKSESEMIMIEAKIAYQSAWICYGCDFVYLTMYSAMNAWESRRTRSEFMCFRNFLFVLYALGKIICYTLFVSNLIILNQFWTAVYYMTANLVAFTIYIPLWIYLRFCYIRKQQFTQCYF